MALVSNQILKPGTAAFVLNIFGLTKVLKI